MAATLPPGVTATATHAGSAPPPAPTISGASLRLAETVNVRSGPGTEFDVLGQYYRGAVVRATGKNAEPATWWRVEFAAAPGGQGWLAAQFAVPNAEALKLPVVWGTATPTAAPAATATRAPRAPSSTAAPTAVPVPSNTLLPASTAVPPTVAASATPGTGGASSGAASVGDLVLPIGLVLVVIGFVLWRMRKG